MSYNVSKYLWEVPNPYSVEDALDFIRSAHIDFNSLKALHFAIEYKTKLKNNIPSDKPNLLKLKPGTSVI